MKRTPTVLACLLLALAPASCGDEPKTASTPAPANVAPGDKDPQANADAIDGSQTDSDGDGIYDLYDSDPNVAERTRETPDPTGEYKLRCDYELGDFGESGDPSQGYRFIAGGTLHNIGNVGIRVRVTYSWKRLGQNALVVKKHYRLRRGETRDVNLTLPVSESDIDAHQSADGDCTAKATVLSSFGQPPYE
jgi:hypothetical protein